MKLMISLLLTISLFGKTEIFEYPTLTNDIFKNTKYLNFILNILNEHLLMQNKIPVKLTSKIDEEQFRKDFANAKYKIITVSPMQYFKNQEFYDKYSKEKSIPKINKKVFHQYYLLANKNEKNIFKNINKYTLYLPDAFPTADIWMKLFLYKKTKQKLKKIIYSAKPNIMVHKIFFNKNYLTVIDRFAYETLIEFNPQIKNKINILLKSRPIYFNLLTLTHKNITEKEKNIMKLLRKEVKVFFEQTTLSFNGELGGNKKVTQEDISELKDIIKQYYKLKTQ